MPLAETLQRRIKPLKYDSNDEVSAGSPSHSLLSDELSSANDSDNEDASTASTDNVEAEGVK